MRAIAEVIGRHLDLPVTSITPEEAGEHFGWVAPFFALDVIASSALTRERLGWQRRTRGSSTTSSRGTTSANRPPERSG